MSTSTLFGELLTAIHSRFEPALPSMDSVLRYQFRKWPRRYRADALADAREACWHARFGLIRRGKDPLTIRPRPGTGFRGGCTTNVYNERAQHRLGLTTISRERFTETDLSPGAADRPEC